MCGSLETYLNADTIEVAPLSPTWSHDRRALRQQGIATGRRLLWGIWRLAEDDVSPELHIRKRWRLLDQATQQQEVRENVHANSFAYCNTTELTSVV